MGNSLISACGSGAAIIRKAERKLFSPHLDSRNGYNTLAQGYVCLTSNGMWCDTFMRRRSLQGSLRRQLNVIQGSQLHIET